MKNAMTQGSMVKALVSFTVPLVLSGLLQQLFSWVDALIVGNVEGELALGGIGATTSVSGLLVMVIGGFTSGLSVLVAQKYGKGESAFIRRILSSFVCLLGSGFLAAALLGIALITPILTLLDTPANLFAVGREYLRILLVGVPFLAVYNTYSAVLRGIGDSRAPFLAVLVCSGINVALDFLFVVALRYSVAGAAAATVLSQAAMTVFVVAYAARRYGILRFRPGRGLVDWAAVTDGLRFGLPPAVQSGVGSVGNLVLQRFMNGFGEQTVAAVTTCYRIDSVIMLPIVNLGSGIATAVAQNVGAGNRQRAGQALKTGVVMMAALALGLTALVIFGGGPLVAIFGLTAASVEIGRLFFCALGGFYLVYGMAMALRGYLEGTGDMLFVGLTAIAALGVRIASSYLFAAPFGNMVIAYAEGFSWVVLMAVYFARFCRRSRQTG